MTYSEGTRVPRPFQASGAHPSLVYSTAISTARNPMADCYKGSWSLFAVCSGAGTCGDFLPASTLELRFGSTDQSYRNGKVEMAAGPIRVWPNNLDELVFRDITLGYGNGLDGYDGGTVRIAFALPSDDPSNPWIIDNDFDFGTRPIDFSKNKNANGEFSLYLDEVNRLRKKPNSVSFSVMRFQSNVVNTNVFWAHMTLTPPNGEPVTHILPILVCAFNPIKKGSNGVYMAPTESIPGVIRIKNGVGKNAFVRPGPNDDYYRKYLATYDNRETAEAAYAKYGGAFDDWVKECMNCNEDCGGDGYSKFEFNNNGDLVDNGMPSYIDFPNNCTKSTNWKLYHMDVGVYDETGLSGTIHVMGTPIGGGDEYELTTLYVTGSHDTETEIFTIPPCTECRLTGKGDPIGYFTLNLKNEDEDNSDERECTNEIIDAYHAIPKNQEEWDETHNANELEQEMGE